MDKHKCEEIDGIFFHYNNEDCPICQWLKDNPPHRHQVLVQSDDAIVPVPFGED